MASAQVVETSVTNNSPSQDSYHPDDLFQSRKVCTSWYDIVNQINNYRDDATQCAAVTIQSGAIRDPPQMNLPPRRRAI
ncbi:hypothetical protein P5673_018186 [Acropora cervicornis]|uniref:Uncharacterized protein n=1 Tax=Acropora cervicornis TaxID=6130 RepID=A0AAD9QDZ2_ACRCE|nr:hypothetical protein P5673_018186 [Acropora cervicornis]